MNNLQSLPPEIIEKIAIHNLPLSILNIRNLNKKFFHWINNFLTSQTYSKLIKKLLQKQLGNNKFIDEFITNENNINPINKLKITDVFLTKNINLLDEHQLFNLLNTINKDSAIYCSLYLTYIGIKISQFDKDEHVAEWLYWFQKLYAWLELKAKKYNYMPVNLAGMIAQGIDLSHLYLNNINFSRATLTTSIIKSTHILRCHFNSASLSLTEFDGSNVIASDFTAANAEHASFNKTRLWNSNFERAILYGTSLLNADSFQVNFNEAHFDNLSLTRNVHISGASFLGTNITYYSFCDAEELNSAQKKILTVFSQEIKNFNNISQLIKLYAKGQKSILTKQKNLEVRFFQSGLSNPYWNNFIILIQHQACLLLLNTNSMLDLEHKNHLDTIFQEKPYQPTRNFLNYRNIYNELINLKAKVFIQHLMENMRADEECSTALTSRSL